MGDDGINLRALKAAAAHHGDPSPLTLKMLLQSVSMQVSIEQLVGKVHWCDVFACVEGSLPDGINRFICLLLCSYV